MQTNLADLIRDTRDGVDADAILRKCVHCGFCTATCPTYQLSGDELEGPRGRIYLIKQVLEGEPATEKTQQHLDRCLTCRNCESTCPSGVQYARLLDIGRKVVDRQVARPLRQRIARQARAEGEEASLRIRSDAERERTVLLAEARAQADRLRGEGEVLGTRQHGLPRFAVAELPEQTPLLVEAREEVLALLRRYGSLDALELGPLLDAAGRRFGTGAADPIPI